MPAEEQNKEQLLEELDMLRSRVAELERLVAKNGVAHDILWHSDEWYRLLFDSAKDAVFVYKRGPDDRPGEYIDVNQVACDRLDYSRDELLALSPHNIVPEVALDKAKKTRERLLKEKHIIFETVHVTKNGSTIPVENSSHLFEVGGQPVVLVISRDISERKRVEKELKQAHSELEKRVDRRTAELMRTNEQLQFEAKERKQAEELYQTLTNNVQMGVYVIQDKKFIFANPRFRKSAGLKPDWLINVDPALLIHPDDRESVRVNAIKMLKGQRNQPYEYRVQAKDGKITAILETVSSIIYRGKRSTLGCCLDITDLKQMEGEITRKKDELLAKADELERANIELKEADRMKSIFIANMSHELRTPLNSIIGFTGLVLQGMSGYLNDDQRKQLGLVKENANQLLNLIGEILDLSQVEAGMIDLAVDKFNVRELVDEALYGFESAIDAKKLKLAKEIPQNINILADRKRIKQILMNLISNAVKYTEKGGLAVSASIAGKLLQLSVKDTGVGMGQDYLSRVFRPFQQVEMVRIRTHQGTGLGLYLSKKIANLMGGDITASSKPGAGSEFVYTTPVEVVG